MLRASDSLSDLCSDLESENLDSKGVCGPLVQIPDGVVCFRPWGCVRNRLLTK